MLQLHIIVDMLLCLWDK